MHVGLYFDLRNPAQWRRSWSYVYGFVLEVCAEAEHLGAHSAWFSEHHGFDDGYLSQPLTFAAAVAARTRSIRLGTAVVLAPLYPVALIAEQAALVDTLSGGRLELGLGAGYRRAEFELYCRPFGERFSATDASVTELRRLWSDGRLLPGPVQEPLPIWLGYGSPAGARRAGQLGAGLLSSDPTLWPSYREGLLSAGLDPGAGRMAGRIQGWISEDPESDWPVVARHLAYQKDSYNRYRHEGRGVPPDNVDPQALRSAGITGGANSWLQATPDAAAAAIVDFIGEAPVDTVFFWASLPGLPEEMVRRHVHTVCTRLAPLLADQRLPAMLSAPESPVLCVHALRGVLPVEQLKQRDRDPSRGPQCLPCLA
jgi:alkanesulfonate monooxygenase SsuD/methylene tetrahydromethanopterin reductase-like flavin-dependent oxidoreductase (luciferase family)